MTEASYLALALAVVTEVSRVINEAVGDNREINYSIAAGDVDYQGPGGWMESYQDGSYKIEITIGKGSQEYQEEQKAKMEKLLRPDG